MSKAIHIYVSFPFKKSTHIKIQVLVMSKRRTNLLYAAMRARYEAEVREAIATIDVYFNNATGIGEHSQLIEEIDKQFDKLVHAEDKLEALEDFFEEDGTPVDLDEVEEEDEEEEEK